MDWIKPIFKESFDVLVVGGGIAGVCAAVSAARLGKKTLLIEKQNNLGGLATVGLINWFEPLCDGKGHQITGGIAEELIKISVQYCYDTLPPAWGGSKLSLPKSNRFATTFSPMVFSMILDEFVMNSGARILFDTYATYPVMDGNICTGVITENCNGREFYKATAVVDATGDASIMYRANVPCRAGSNYMTYIIHGFEKTDIAPAEEAGNLSLLRKWMVYGSDLNGNGQPAGIKKRPYLSAEERTEYILHGKAMLLGKLKEKNRFSFEIMSLPSMPQLRTIRQIIGDTDFNAVDGEKYPDSIGCVSDFREGKEGCCYEIPLSALRRSDFPNLFAAGRIISAPEGDGWEVARVIPTCALTGEAAGRAAAGYCNSTEA